MTTELELCTSAGMQRVRELIGKVAGTNATVLLRGESGVGKEIVAHTIHRASPRANKPFLKLNCAALPEELIESELFGHERGAFTGAYRDKPGKFEMAQHGTLLLDEIGEIPPRLQAKLLHALQDGEFARVGGERIIDADVRIIAATNRDLEDAMRTGQFREDLYYRLNVIEIRVPPLRERRGEIPMLTDHFLRRFNKEYGRSVAIPPATMHELIQYSWPGNVRELENMLKRSVVLGSVLPLRHQTVSLLEGEIATVEAVTGAPTAAITGDAQVGLKDIARRAARDAERVAIEAVLERVHWNRRQAARLLQVSYRTLLNKIGDCRVARPDSEKDEVSLA